MNFEIPEFALVLLLGPASIGQEQFAAKHFEPRAYLNPNKFKDLIAEPETSNLEEDSYTLLFQVLEMRLRHRQICCVDVPHLNVEELKKLKRLSKQYHCRLIAISFDFPLQESQKLNAELESNPIAPHIFKIKHSQHLQRSKFLKEEGFRQILRFNSQAEANSAKLEFKKLRCDLRSEQGPFDIIGDVHGCLDELLQLLALLGYQIQKLDNPSKPWKPFTASHPEGRRIVFVGDYCDRGPDSPGVFKLVMSLFECNIALGVPGNHDDKLERKLSGRDVSLKHGLAETIEQFKEYPQEFHEEVRKFIKSLPSHIVLQNGELVVAHAGLKSSMHNRSSSEIHSFCIYGETTGQKDEFGLPIRLNWAANYSGKAMIVYGHTPILEAEWENNTIDIDTGCVFGGKLTALRYPEKELVHVNAIQKWMEPSRPLSQIGNLNDQKVENKPALNANLFQENAGFTCQAGYLVTFRAHQIEAIQKHFSRHTVNPRWIASLPVPFNVIHSGKIKGYLEHPASAFDYYKEHGQNSVHLQLLESPIRATILLCKDEASAFRRIGSGSEGIGKIYGKNARPIFEDIKEEQSILRRISHHFQNEGIWDAFQTDWICFECEVRPFSKIAPDLFDGPFQSLSLAARTQTDFVLNQLNAANKNEALIAEIETNTKLSQKEIREFDQVLKRLKTNQKSLRFVPLFVHATERKVNSKQSTKWHRALCEKIVNAVPTLFEMPVSIEIDLNSESEKRKAIEFWENECANSAIAALIIADQYYIDLHQDLIYPGIIARSPAFLRMIYGLQFDRPNSLLELQGKGNETINAAKLRQLGFLNDALSSFANYENWEITFRMIFAALGLEMQISDPRIP